MNNSAFHARRGSKENTLHLDSLVLQKLAIDDCNLGIANPSGSKGSGKADFAGTIENRCTWPRST